MVIPSNIIRRRNIGCGRNISEDGTERTREVLKVMASPTVLKSHRVNAGCKQSILLKRHDTGDTAHRGARCMRALHRHHRSTRARNGAHGENHVRERSICSRTERSMPRAVKRGCRRTHRRKSSPTVRATGGTMSGVVNRERAYVPCTSSCLSSTLLLRCLASSTAWKKESVRSTTTGWTRVARNSTVGAGQTHRSRCRNKKQA